MFGTLGGPELFFIFVIALIVFGPRKLPEIGKSLGKMVGEFRRASNDLKRTIEDEVETERLRDMAKLGSAEATPASPSDGAATAVADPYTAEAQADTPAAPAPPTSD
jgi:Tat protein translocase TatB subunit